MSALRFPYAPLRDVARLAIPLTDTPTGEHTYEGRRSFAKVLGASTRVIQRWQRDGLNVFEADQAATALDQHPSAIWLDWYKQESGADLSEGSEVAHSDRKPATHPEGDGAGEPAATVRSAPAPLGSCCTCQACGSPVICERACLPCTYGVCANDDRPDPCGCGYYVLTPLPA